MTYLGFSLNPYKGINNCIYKLFYGDHYVVVKAKHCAGSLRAIQKSLNQYLRGSESQRNPAVNKLYYKFFQYIENNPGQPFSATVFFAEGTDYQALMMEQRYLFASSRDRRCLNARQDAYVCKWNSEKEMFNWLSQNAVLNFNRYKGNNSGGVFGAGVVSKKSGAKKGKGKKSVASKKSESSAKGKKNIRKKSKATTAKKATKSAKSAPKKKTAAKKIVPAKAKATSKKPAPKKQTKKKK